MESGVGHCTLLVAVVSSSFFPTAANDPTVVGQPLHSYPANYFTRVDRGNPISDGARHQCIIDSAQNI